MGPATLAEAITEAAADAGRTRRLWAIERLAALAAMAAATGWRVS